MGFITDEYHEVNQLRELRRWPVVKVQFEFAFQSTKFTYLKTEVSRSREIYSSIRKISP